MYEIGDEPGLKEVVMEGLETTMGLSSGESQIPVEPGDGGLIEGKTLDDWLMDQLVTNVNL